MLPFRPRLDPRTSALQVSTGGRTLNVVHARAQRAERARARSDIRRLTPRVFHVQQGTITGVGGTCTPPQITVGDRLLRRPSVAP